MERETHAQFIPLLAMWRALKKFLEYKLRYEKSVICVEVLEEMKRLEDFFLQPPGRAEGRRSPGNGPDD